MNLRFFKIFLIYNILCSCSEVSLVTSMPEIDDSAEVPGVAVVKFSEAVITKGTEGLDMIKEEDWISVRRLFPYSGKYEERTMTEGLHRWYVVEYDPKITYTKASEDIFSLEGVEMVEPMFPIVQAALFNDPFLNKQWHYVNDGTMSNNHVRGIDINVSHVWDRHTAGNMDVVVGVVDGGIDQTHEDLYENCIGGYNFVKDNANISAHDHGTHVAGTIAAMNNNGKGGCGIAGGDYINGERGVSLLSCQIFEHKADSEFDESADGAVAIKWAADHGALIVNNSWGFEFASYREAEATKIPMYLKDAIDYFIKYAGTDENGHQIGLMKGGLVVFAAGNSGWNTDPIGLYEPVLAVGALGPDGRKAPYSNYGHWVDISAPGGNTRYYGGSVFSTLPNNSYGEMQGTSMACPHVTGVAALIVSKYGGPGFTVEELQKRLLEGADAEVPDVTKVGPMLNALSSLVYGNKIAPEKVCDFKASYVKGRLRAKWTVTEDKDEIKAYGYKVLISEKRDLLDQACKNDIPVGCRVVNVRVGSKSIGDEIEVESDELKLGCTYYIAVTGYDRSDNYSGISNVEVVKTPENQAPQIKGYDIDTPIAVGAHDKHEVLIEIYDPEGHDVNVYLDDTSSSASLLEEGDGRYSVVITGNGLMAGNHIARVKAVDSFGAETECRIPYELLSNESPIVVKPLDNQISYSLGDQFIWDLSEYFFDPDKGVLKYEIEISDESLLHVTLDNDELKAVVKDYGFSEITICAIDSYGESVTVKFSILVKASQDLDIFPNPVMDDLYISAPEYMTVRFVIFSQIGTVCCDKILTLSPIEYYQMDMNDYKTGLYGVFIQGEGFNYYEQIIKL